MIYPLRRVSHYGYKFLDKGKYGEYHPGVDLNSGVGNEDLGEPILAPYKGIITSVHRNCGAWGNHFHLKCDTLLGTRWFHFGHCQDIMVSPNQQVSEGEVIAKVGNSGGDWSAHLHFECKKKAVGVDFYPSKTTTKKFVLDSYEDPLVFIDNINNLNQQNNDVEGMKDIVGTLTNQLLEANKEIEGLQAQVRNHNDFIDKMWCKLSPITVGEKNESTIMGEFEKLIYDEDQLTGITIRLKEITEKFNAFVVKICGLLNASSVSESNAEFEIKRLHTNLTGANKKIEKLINEVVKLESIHGLDDASSGLLFLKLCYSLFRKGSKNETKK